MMNRSLFVRLPWWNLEASVISTADFVASDPQRLVFRNLAAGQSYVWSGGVSGAWNIVGNWTDTTKGDTPATRVPRINDWSAPLF